MPRAQTKLARSSRRGSAATPLEIAECFMCKGTIEPFEPFQLAMTIDGDGQIRNLPYHQACELDAVATVVGDEIEAVDEGTGAESIGGRLRDLVETLLEEIDGRRK